MKYTGELYGNKIATDIAVAKKFLSFLPEKIREQYQTGVAPETLAEIVTAKARGTLALDKNGYDLMDGAEVKYALYKQYNNGAWKAAINNLNSKRGKNADLCVIIAFDCESGIEFRYFIIPPEAWESNVVSNSLDMAFQTNAWKWYLAYEVSEKEYGIGSKRKFDSEKVEFLHKTLNLEEMF